MNDEMLGDFLDEAGDLLEELGPQLVDLEQDPENPDLLNAVFRAFHTVKGGAGFLDIGPMVELCHKAEDVFNLVRNGEISVDAHIMDLAQRSLDVLTDQMSALGEGEEPPSAPSDLLEALSNAMSGNTEPVVEDKPAEPLMDMEGDITEDEFEALLDQLHGDAPPTAKQEEPAPSVEETAEEAPAQEPSKETQEAEKQDKPASKPRREVAEPTVRVETRRLDALMNQVGELVLVRNRLKTLRENYRSPPLERAIGELDAITYSLQTAVMSTRMQPIGKLFARFPKLTRDLARSLNKEIELELAGQDEDLDKNLVEALADPMVHLVRNAIDHGVESPEVREKRAKSRAGKLRLSAQQEGDNILIHIQDDGAGMDAELLRRKAIEKGVITEDAAAHMTDEESYQLIFMPGFSTKTEVSEVSGRGVGMDVVKSRINELNGQINITSELGQGSCFTLRLPLTLAILPTLMTGVEDSAFALPLSAVEEVFLLQPEQLRNCEGRQVAWVRDTALPLLSLRKWAEPGCEDPYVGHVVVTQFAGSRYGVVVDNVTGREEVVIKPLGNLLSNASGVAGATVTGHGGIALILDLDQIAHEMGVAA